MTKKHLIRLYPQFKIACGTQFYEGTIIPYYVTCQNCIRCMSLAETRYFLGYPLPEVSNQYKEVKDNG